MDIQIFKDSKKVVSTDLYVEDNSVTNRAFLGITEDADFVVQFTSDVEFEVCSNDSISPEYIVDVLDEDNNSVYDRYSSTSSSIPSF